MTHRIFLFLLSCTLLAMTGCKDSPKSMSDLKGGTPADSMMYYFGQMQASTYWQDAESDTILRSEKSREEFMKGLRAAMAMDEDNSAYNRGLQLGLRLAIRLREFKDRYGVDFPEEVLAAALENSLKSDTGLNLAAAQKGFYAIKDRLELQAARKDVEKATGNLAKDAKARGFKMLSDTLYSKSVTPGHGPNFKMGDRLAVEVTASTLDGKEIVTRQFPDSITLGEGRVPVAVRTAIFTMKSGETCQFMTTPRSLLGKRYAIYKLPADQPVIFTVKANQGAGVSGVKPDAATEVE